MKLPNNVPSRQWLPTVTKQMVGMLLITSSKGARLGYRVNVRELLINTVSRDERNVIEDFMCFGNALETNALTKRYMASYFLYIWEYADIRAIGG